MNASIARDIAIGTHALGFFSKKVISAEREGFEPSDQFDPVSTLAPCRTRPLCDLSLANKPYHTTEV